MYMHQSNIKQIKHSLLQLQEFVKKKKKRIAHN